MFEVGYLPDTRVLKNHTCSTQNTESSEIVPNFYLKFGWSTEVNTEVRHVNIEVKLHTRVLPRALNPIVGRVLRYYPTVPIFMGIVSKVVPNLPKASVEPIPGYPRVHTLHDIPRKALHIPTTTYPFAG